MNATKTSPEILGRVETAVREVYGYCPPTLTSFGTDGRAAYENYWKGFMAALGVQPEAFAGCRLLDVGCGSCEKATFYHDWGAHVTGVEMTPSIVALGRQTIGDRDITVIQTSLFEFSPDEPFDIVIADGVLHHTADTYASLARCAAFVREGGLLVFGLVNVWGTFWWFKPARAITRLLGGSNFHRRARWGQALFGWTRAAQENEGGRGGFYRSPDSWAYDWFGNPRWNAHGPAEVRRWLDRLGCTYVASTPSFVTKPCQADGSRRGLLALLAAIAGDGPALMSWAWLLSGQPNMFYVCARKTHQPV
jgi:2-polyprenyl-3-methyl-5-hydroxy-6-metoxy-1,4-benzoquinol methylase